MAGQGRSINRPPKLELITFLRKLEDEGYLDFKYVCYHYNVSQTTFWKWCKRYNLKVKWNIPNQRKKNMTYKTINGKIYTKDFFIDAFYNKFYTMAQLASLLGVSRQRIRQITESLEVEYPPASYRNINLTKRGIMDSI